MDANATAEESKLAAVQAKISNNSVNYSDELNTNINDYISKLNQSEYQSMADGVLGEGSGKGLAEDESEVTTNPDENSSSQSTEVKPAETQPEVKDRGFERLAAREAEVLAKEKDFERKLAEAVKGKVPDFTGKDPEDVLKYHGFDAELALKQMMFSRLSDDNPIKAKLKDELRDFQTEKKFKEMKAELERRDNEKAQTEYFQSISNGARLYAEKEVDEKVTPNFALVAKAKPERVHKAIMQKIVSNAQERLARGEDGDPLSYTEAAKMVEDDWKELAEIFGGKKESVAKPVSAAVSAVEKRVTKPVVKPVEEMSPGELTKYAINKATEVFWKEEKKAGRVK